MTWQWVSLIGIIAFWTVSLQVIHGWIQVNRIRVSAVYAAMDPQSPMHGQVEAVLEDQ